MLTIPFLQLETHLQRTPLQCYVISGDEPFLKNELLQQLREHAKTRGFQERHHFDLQQKEMIDACYITITNIDLFQQPQLIEIHLPEGALTKSLQQQLRAMVLAQQVMQFYVFIAGKLDEKALKLPWLTEGACQKGLVRIPFFNQQVALQWIENKASQFNLLINKEIAQWIYHHCYNQWLYVHQLFEKCALIGATSPLTLAAINELLSDESQFSIFELLDPLFSANAAETLHVLDNLKHNAVDPILILWAITKDLRILIEALHTSTASAFNWSTFYEKHRIFSHRQPLIKRALQRFSRLHMETQLIRALEIEFAIKGLLPEDPWSKLTEWCQQWCAAKLTTPGNHVS